MPNVNDTLGKLLEMDGAMAAALVDYESGMVLGSVGNGIDLDIASAGNTEVVRAKMKTMKMLGLDGAIEDILITLDEQYHIIRLSKKTPGTFLYYVLDKDRSNLALARRKSAEVEAAVVI